MMTLQKLSEKLCEKEGLKKQVNIAQMNEIVSKIPSLLFETFGTPEDCMEFLFSKFIESLDYGVEIGVTKLDGKLSCVDICIEKYR